MIIKLNMGWAAQFERLHEHIVLLEFYRQRIHRCWWRILQMVYGADNFSSQHHCCHWNSSMTERLQPYAWTFNGFVQYACYCFFTPYLRVFSNPRKQPPIQNFHKTHWLRFEPSLTLENITFVLLLWMTRF